MKRDLRRFTFSVRITDTALKLKERRYCGVDYR